MMHTMYLMYIAWKHSGSDNEREKRTTDNLTDLRSHIYSLSRPETRLRPCTNDAPRDLRTQFISLHCVRLAHSEWAILKHKIYSVKDWEKRLETITWKEINCSYLRKCQTFYHSLTSFWCCLLTPPRWQEKDLGNNKSTIFSNFILKMLLNTKKIWNKKLYLQFCNH